MSKKNKTRQSLSEILASCSDTLFPAQMGQAVVEIDSADADGDTALHVLMWRGNNFGIKCLIAAGANVNAVGDMSETPLHIAVRKENVEINVEIIVLLLNAGADPNALSEFNETPRSMADARGGDLRQLFVGR